MPGVKVGEVGGSDDAPQRRTSSSPPRAVGTLVRGVASALAVRRGPEQSHRMAGLGLRLRAWFRGRRALVLVTAVVVGIVAGLAMGLVAGTRRTASAPDRYTEWSGGDPDLIIQQQTGDPL